MTLKEFREHFEATTRKPSESHVVRLAKLRIMELLDFGHWWKQTLGQAHHGNLWGAAGLINGGWFDDGFDYFCRCLILQGHDVFRTAIKKLDSREGRGPGRGGSGMFLRLHQRCVVCRDRSGAHRTGLRRAAEVARHAEPDPLPELDDSGDANAPPAAFRATWT